MANDKGGGKASEFQLTAHIYPIERRERERETGIRYNINNNININNTQAEARRAILK